MYDIYTTERWACTSHCGSGLIKGKTQAHLISATEIEGSFGGYFGHNTTSRATFKLDALHFRSYRSEYDI
jgi:hypothetical protein